MTESVPIQQAFIELKVPKAGWRWLLNKPLAGIPVFDRLLFTLSRAGIERMAVWAPGLSESERQTVTARLAEDPRLQAQWRWLANTASEEAGAPPGGIREDQPCLVISGNSVTTAPTLKKIFQRAQGPVAQNKMFRFGSGGGSVMPAFHPEWQESLRQNQTPEAVTGDFSSDDAGFLVTVVDGASFRAAERSFLEHHKRHYTQLLDVHFNSYFSIPISSLLVRLPVTPNQLTLFGLLIGAAAGMLFARGDYISGLLGGLLLIFTAIWDCCDGDVARLKFMESDFGETLDTICDNVINVFVFTGLAMGVAKTHGTLYALLPFLLLTAGGLGIFALIYFPQGGKGNFFKDSPMYEVILLLASRNFIYIIAAFALIGRLNWFLWLAGLGSIVFAMVLALEKRKIRSANLP